MTPVPRLLRWWRDISIARKLYFAMGLMAALLLCELATLRFAMYSLTAARAFVGGEGLWSKSQKNAGIDLQRYGRTRDARDYQAFLRDLAVPEGDHQARLALSKPVPDLAAARTGFLQGRIPPDDVEPMIDLLRRFSWTPYIARAIAVWTGADALLDRYRDAGEAFHAAATRGDEEQVLATSVQLGQLNDQLTALEDEFSFVLGVGSRWLERVVLTLLSIAVLIVESVGLSLTWLTIRSISRGLDALNGAALRIGRGDFSEQPEAPGLPPRSNDEIGRLARAVAQMRGMLERSYGHLEARVEERTRELARSRHELDVILRGITDGITVIDDKGSFVFANQAGANMCGAASVEELLAKPRSAWAEPLDIRHEDGRPFPVSELPSSLAFAGHHDPPEAILRYRRGGKEERWSLVKSAPIFDEERKARLVVTVFKDFTEHRRTEDATRFLDEVSQVLASSLNPRDTLREVVELTAAKFTDACFLELVDPEGESHRVSRLRGADGSLTAVEWAVELGASQVVLTGKSETYGLDAHSHGPEGLAIPAELGLRSVAVVPVISHGKTFGALALALGTSAHPFSPAELRVGEELGRRIGTALDNATLFQMAQRAAMARENFLSIASHELKTPLTALSLQTQLTRQRLERKAREGIESLTPIVDSLDVVDRQIDRLTRLANELLDVSRMQFGKLVIAFQEVSLSDLVQEVAQRFGEQIERTGTQLVLEVTPGIRGVFDPIRVEQIVDNLLTNALRYAPGAPIALSLSGTETTARLMVSDQGPGIAAEHQARIFERFERATTKHAASGLGLGLYIVREIVNGHGGSVRVESQPGAGACFIIDLPLLGPADSRPDPANPFASGARTTDKGLGLPAAPAEGARRG